MSSSTSKKIVEKFKKQLSEHDRLSLERQITVPNRMKQQTYKVTDTLDTITQAIDSNLQVGLGQKIREAGGVDLCPA